MPIKLLILLLTAIITVSCSPGVKTRPFSSSTVHNFGKVDSNVYRGTQPHGAKDYRGLKDLGINTILNLRDDYRSDEANLALSQGLQYRNIPMSSTAPPTTEQITEAMEILNDPSLWPVYVHCQGGLHRTGVVIAVYRVQHGFSKYDAWSEALKYGYYRGFSHGVIEDWFLGPLNPFTNGSGLSEFHPHP